MTDTDKELAAMSNEQLAACLLALARLRNAWNVYENSVDTSADWQEVRAAQRAVKEAVGDALNSDAIRFARDVG